MALAAMATGDFRKWHRPFGRRLQG